MMKINFMLNINVQNILLFLITIFIIYNSFLLLELNANFKKFLNLLGLPEPATETESNVVKFKDNCNVDKIEGYDFAFVYLVNCPFCRKEAPVLEKIENETSVKILWLNVEACPEKVQKYVPTFNGFVPHLYCFKKNISHTGYMEEPILREWINNCLN